MDLLPYFLEDDDDLLAFLLHNLPKKRIYHNPKKCRTPFVFESLSDDFCWLHFRFYKNDLLRLRTALKLPDLVVCRKRVTVSGIEGLCILLKKLTYPGRYQDLMRFFPRTRCEISRILNQMLSTILKNHLHRITDLNQNWQSLQLVEEFTKVLAAKDCPFRECFGFVDGTVRTICRPKLNQKDYYNGHKRVHALKFQSVSLPNGIIAHMYGPVHGRRHDSNLLHSSKLIDQLEARFSRWMGLLTIYMEILRTL